MPNHNLPLLPPPPPPCSREQFVAWLVEHAKVDPVSIQREHEPDLIYITRSHPDHVITFPTIAQAIKACAMLAKQIKEATEPRVVEAIAGSAEYYPELPESERWIVIGHFALAKLQLELPTVSAMTIGFCAPGDQYAAVKVLRGTQDKEFKQQLEEWRNSGEVYGDRTG